MSNPTATAPIPATAATKATTPRPRPPEARRQAVPAQPAPRPVEAPSAVPAALTDPLALSARAKLHAIELELNATFAERSREARGIITALVAREHILLLGPAGTGKSALAQVTTGALDGATYFGWLLTRFSTPEEVFGPVSLDGLKQDRFRRVTSGKLPEATVAFLDEIFKANSAVLNSLLTALNERAFDNDGGRITIPLQTLVGASNELPDGPELAALFDRFLLRYWTTYTKTPDAFQRLMTGDEPSITTQITMAELEAAQAAVAAVGLDAATCDELFKLRTELVAKGIIVSDRRWRKVGKILRATAWLEGATDVGPDVFPVLASCLWDDPSQMGTVGGLVAQYTSAQLNEAQQAFDAIVSMIAEMPPAKDPAFGSKVSGVTHEIKRAITRLKALEASADKPRTKDRIRGLTADLDKKYEDVRKAALEAMGI
jgi:MoxR-like ATPase